MMRITRCFVMCLLAVALAAEAQIQTGSIFVQARDAQGAFLPGVTVSISSPVLVREMTGVTGSDGAYRFPALPPGTYALTLKLSGFQTVRREGIVVSVASTTSLEVSMTVGVEETVTVTAASPTVDTSSNTVGTLIDTGILQKTPGAHDLWSLLEYKVPALVSSRPDVGGSESGLQAGFVAKGTPHGQNTQALNGVNVSDPEAIGFADFYYDYDSFQEVQVSTGSHSVEVGTPGVYVNMVTKSGGDHLAGQTSAYYQSHRTQSNNITRDLAAKGIKKAGFDFLSDVSAQLGGPLMNENLRFFASVRDWRVHRFVSGFVDANGTPVVEPTDMFSYLVNLTYQATAKHNFGLFWTRQTYFKPQRGASAQNTPLSDWKEDDIFDIYQGSWNGVLGPNTFANARVSWVNIFFPLFIKQQAKDQDLQSVLETTTGVRTGSNNFQFIFKRHRLQANGGVSYFKDRWMGVRHEFRVGYDLSHSPNSFEPSAIDELNLFTTNGKAAFVTLYNTPRNTERNVDSYAVFGQDSIHVPRWTFNAGVRIEKTRGYLPAQSSPASRWFPDEQQHFPKVDNIPNWTNAAPRVGLIFDVSGDGRTAIKANYARYYYQISTGVPNSVNPNGIGGETFIWNDLNGDLKFQAGETGRSLGKFGGLRTIMDPHIRQPRSDEFEIGVDHELLPGFSLSTDFVYRKDRDLIGQRNIGAIWIPKAVTDPVTGNSITVYEQDPSTFALNRFLITNADSLNIDYRGVDIVAQKRFSHRWQMLTSYTWSRGTQDQVADLFGTGVPSVDPNNLVNAKGPTFWDRTHVFKTSAMVSLAYGIDLSGNFRFQTGQPFSRQIATRLSQGSVTVNAEPRGARRYPNITTLDLRVAKGFRFGGRVIELMLDGYNLTNESTPVSLVELSGPKYRFPLQILGPRIFRLGAYVTF